MRVDGDYIINGVFPLLMLSSTANRQTDISFSDSFLINGNIVYESPVLLYVLVAPWFKNTLPLVIN